MATFGTIIIIAMVLGLVFSLFEKRMIEIIKEMLK